MAEHIHPYFLPNQNPPTLTYTPEGSPLQPKLHEGWASTQENMEIMANYPRSPDHAVAARERRWYQQALQLWKEWGHKMEEHEKATWKREVPFLLRTSKKKKAWVEHRFCSSIDITWTHWTFLKILFPLDWILGSQVALRVQVKFPQAGLTQWAPNTNGPTKDRRFRASRHLRNLPGEPYNPGVEGHGESTNFSIKKENSNVRRSEEIEDPPAQGTDPTTGRKAPAIAGQHPVKDGAQLHNETPPPAFQRSTEGAGQEPLGFFFDLKGDLEPEDEKIAHLENLTSDMRRNEMRQMRQEISELRRNLERANERILLLEAARARQEQERAALREAFAQGLR